MLPQCWQKNCQKIGQSNLTAICKKALVGRVQTEKQAMEVSCLGDLVNERYFRFVLMVFVTGDGIKFQPYAFFRKAGVQMGIWRGAIQVA